MANGVCDGAQAAGTASGVDVISSLKSLYFVKTNRHFLYSHRPSGSGEMLAGKRGGHLLFKFLQKLGGG